MKKNITITLLFMGSVHFSHANTLQAAGGSFFNEDNTLVTYSFTAGELPTQLSSGGLRTNDQNDFTTTLTFTGGPATLNISSASLAISGFTAFDDAFNTAGGISSTFTFNSGSSIDLTSTTMPFGSFNDITISAQSDVLTFGTGNPGNTNSGANSNTNFGTVTITDVTSVTWFSTDESNFEGFTFDVVTNVPEPSSTVLLALGGLAILAHRKRP